MGWCTAGKFRRARLARYRKSVLVDISIKRLGPPTESLVTTSWATSEISVVGAGRDIDRASVRSRAARARGQGWQAYGPQNHCYRAETSRGDSRDRTDQAGNQSGLLRKNEPYMVRLCVGEPPNVRYYGTLVLRVFLWSSPPHFERREKHRKEFCHRSTIL